MKKLLSVLLVTALTLSFAPVALAAHVHDEQCGYKAASACTHVCTEGVCFISGTPCDGGDGCDHGDCDYSPGEQFCSHQHDASCGYSAGSPCTYKEKLHICSYSIYDSRGDGTHVVICSGDHQHQMVEKCWSDNNKNHKCDHCGYVMSGHEYSCTHVEDGWHYALCRCGYGFYEACTLVQTGEGKQLCRICGHESNASSLLSGTFSELGFELSIAGETAQELALKNNAGIAAEGMGFSYQIGSDFLSNASGGLRIGSGFDDGVQWSKISSDNDESQPALHFTLSGDVGTETPRITLSGNDTSLGKSFFNQRKIKMPEADGESSFGILSVKLDDTATMSEPDKYALDAEKKLNSARLSLIEADGKDAEALDKAQAAYNEAKTSLEEHSRTQVTVTIPASSGYEHDSCSFLCQEAGEVRSISAVPDDEGNISASFGINSDAIILASLDMKNFHF